MSNINPNFITAEPVSKQAMRDQFQLVKNEITALERVRRYVLRNAVGYGDTGLNLSATGYATYLTFPFPANTRNITAHLVARVYNTTANTVIPFYMAATFISNGNVAFESTVLDAIPVQALQQATLSLPFLSTHALLAAGGTLHLQLRRDAGANIGLLSAQGVIDAEYLL